MHYLCEPGEVQKYANGASGVLTDRKGRKRKGEREREEEYGEKRQKIMKQNKLNTASLTSHSATVCSLVCFLMFVYYFAHSFI